ncbi:MAG: AIR synthase related protein, partial [Dongiaceae bacterium]
VWEQYDHLVMGRTVQRPGGDAAIVRLPDSQRALAIATDCTPRYCAADPKRGGAQAVAESWRNLTAVGALPLALTDNMNFGNPERPEIMGQFAGCIEGMAEACRVLDYPVVSGNVSLYNETNGKGILPTPVIGGVGLIADVEKTASLAFKGAGETIILVGETAGHLGSSLYLREIHGREDGPPPPVDLPAEARNGEFIRKLIHHGWITACHDLSDGGLLVAIAEMAMAGNIGAGINPTLQVEIPLHAWLFGEDQARYLVTAGRAFVEPILQEAKSWRVPAQAIGQTGGAALTLPEVGAISVARLQDANERWLPAYMGAA